MSRHTIRAAVQSLEGFDTEDMAAVISALEAAKVADLAIVEEAGTMLAVDDRTVHLVAWPAGVLIPEIGENLTPTLEVSECENCRRQSILIGQQHDAIRQLTHLVRSLTRIVEVYTNATVYTTMNPEGGDSGQ